LSSTRSCSVRARRSGRSSTGRCDYASSIGTHSAPVSSSGHTCRRNVAVLRRSFAQRRWRRASSNGICQITDSHTGLKPMATLIASMAAFVPALSVRSLGQLVEHALRHAGLDPFPDPLAAVLRDRRGAALMIFVLSRWRLRTLRPRRCADVA
jgi:hypothetical protein